MASHRTGQQKRLSVSGGPLQKQPTYEQLSRNNHNQNKMSKQQQQQRRRVQKKSNNSKKPIRTVKAMPRNAKPIVRIPECTKHYAQALADPFSLNAEVCIPDTHSVPSKKVKFVIRGAGSTQADKFGTVFANPFFVANDKLEFLSGAATCFTGAVAATDGTGTGGSIFMYENITTPNGVAATPLTRSPYSLNEFDQGPEGNLNPTSVGAQARIVGSGLRVRYTGTKLNEGGSILVAKRQDGESFDFFTYDSIASIMNTQMRPLGDKWHQVSYTPVQPTDYDYCRNGCFGSSEPVSSINATEVLKHSRHNMGFVLKSAAPSQPFEWEYVVHVEFLGKIIDNISRSHSDIVGLSAVRNALNASSPTENQSGPGYFSKLLTTVGEELLQSVPSVIGTGLKLLL
jgi:hypothetical protein